MNFFQRLKIKRLQKRINKISLSRDKKFHYIEKDKKIGFVIDASSNVTFHFAKLFEEFLLKNGNNIEKMFFVTKKVSKKEVLPEKTISIHGCKWVKSEIVENFSNKQFDILFILNFTELYEIHYLASIIKADFKVSPQYKEVNYADLTFVLNENSKPEEFFDAVKKYLIET
jgi:Family of unknown function (DUF6913)